MNNKTLWCVFTCKGDPVTMFNSKWEADDYASWHQTEEIVYGGNVTYPYYVLKFVQAA
jgi:hypothetical protein